jgi:hypothetical protein
VLILGAVVLLVLGLIQGSSVMLVGSIATSLLAAVALVVGVRRAGAAPAEDDLEDGEDFDATVEQWAPQSEPLRSTGRASVPLRGEHVSATVPVGGSVPSQVVSDGYQYEYDDEDPPDEPEEQQVTAADAARVARMSAEVLVVDGRPRYHVPGCVHLLGRPIEPLPVNEALELGFSPCALCEPDSALLADARRA